MTTYYEACEQTITREHARSFIENHDADFSEFLDEVGDKEEYVGEEILDWLGY